MEITAIDERLAQYTYTTTGIGNMHLLEDAYAGIGRYSMIYTSSRTNTGCWHVGH